MCVSRLRIQRVAGVLDGQFRSPEETDLAAGVSRRSEPELMNFLVGMYEMNVVDPE